MPVTTDTNTIPYTLPLPDAFPMSVFRRHNEFSQGTGEANGRTMGGPGQTRAGGRAWTGVVGGRGLFKPAGRRATQRGEGLNRTGLRRASPGWPPRR